MFWRKAKSEAEAKKAEEAAKAEAAKVASAKAEAIRLEAIRSELARADAARALAAKSEPVGQQQLAKSAGGAGMAEAGHVRTPPAAARNTAMRIPEVASFGAVPNDAAAAGTVRSAAAPERVETPLDVRSPAATGATPLSQQAGAGADASSRRIVPKNAKSWQTASRALGEIMSVLQHSKRFRATPIGDLDWMIMPAIWAGQYKLGKDSRSKEIEAPPTAAIFWARVSPVVDQRLSQDPTAQIRLRPEEWISGDIVWVVEAVGPEPVIQAMLRQLAEDVVRGPLKVRAMGPKSRVMTATITPGRHASPPAVASAM
jgi:cytolysin-activating lysine-acyltransferase